MLTPQPYGTLLGKPQIGDIAVEVFSNGDSGFISKEHAVDDGGNYMGIRYQCVEFVRRYIYLRHKCNLAARWSAGDAHDWHPCRAAMGLVEVALADAQVGDILTFSGGSFGHVAVLSQRQGQDFEMTSQNFFNSKKDIGFPLSPAVLAQGAVLQDAKICLLVSVRATFHGLCLEPIDYSQKITKAAMQTARRKRYEGADQYYGHGGRCSEHAGYCLS